MNGLMWLVGWKEGRKEGWMDGWMDGWMSRRVEGWIIES